MQTSKTVPTKLTFAVAIILSWISLWASVVSLPYSGNPFEDPDIVAAKAGFPFTVFYYPVPPMGNDIPDQGSFFPFALNTMVYFLLAWVVLRVLPKKWLTVKVEKIIVYSAFWISLFGLFDTIVKFD